MIEYITSNTIAISKENFEGRGCGFMDSLNDMLDAIIETLARTDIDSPRPSAVEFSSSDGDDFYIIFSQKHSIIVNNSESPDLIVIPEDIYHLSREILEDCKGMLDGIHDWALWLSCEDSDEDDEFFAQEYTAEILRKLDEVAFLVGDIES